VISLAEPLRAALESPNKRLATLWRIERADAQVLAFTDHDVPIDFGADTYTPVGGVDASAQRKETGLVGQDRRFVGAVSSPAVTAEDLHAGLYDRAVIDERVVDWMVPWIGAIVRDRYWINEVRFDGLRWQTDVVSITHWLKVNVGGTYGLYCPHDLGDSKCGFALATIPFTRTAVTVLLPTSRYQFTVDSATLPDPTGIPATNEEWYAEGEVEWTTGYNVGTRQVVKIYAHTGRSIELYSSAPHDVVSGDQFTLRVGCNKMLEAGVGDCEDKFTNHLNFGGFPWLPGSDKLLKTPPV
jgi:uncharacterized phage protein (TIGR02218 family)